MTLYTFDPGQMQAVAALMRQTAAEYDSAALRVNAADTAACPPGLAATAADICGLLGRALAGLANELTAGATGLEARAGEAIAANTGGDACCAGEVLAPAAAGAGAANAVVGYTSTGDPYTDILNMESAQENDPANTFTITWGGVPDPSSQSGGEFGITGVDDWGPYSQLAQQGQDQTWLQQPTSSWYTGVLQDTASLEGQMELTDTVYGPDLGQRTSYVPQYQVPVTNMLYNLGNGAFGSQWAVIVNAESMT
jgi:hypothetical protein